MGKVGIDPEVMFNGFGNCATVLAVVILGTMSFIVGVITGVLGGALTTLPVAFPPVGLGILFASFVSAACCISLANFITNSFMEPPI